MSKDLENGNGDAGPESPMLPIVPEELAIDPLLLAVLSTAAFLDFADDDRLDPDSATEVLEAIGGYVQRLPDERLDEIEEQLERLAEHGEKSGWHPDHVDFVRDFLFSCGVDDDGEAEDD